MRMLPSNPKTPEIEASQTGSWSIIGSETEIWFLISSYLEISILIATKIMLCSTSSITPSCWYLINRFNSIIAGIHKSLIIGHS